MIITLIFEAVKYLMTYNKKYIVNLEIKEKVNRVLLNLDACILSRTRKTPSKKHG